MNRDSDASSANTNVNANAGELTRASLLVRIRDRSDTAAWRQFVDIYAPLIYGFARKRGLQDADAADAAQETLRAVSSRIDDFAYDPAKGTFRGWLFTVARHRIKHALKQLHRVGRGSGDNAVHDVLLDLPDEASAQAERDAWEREYQERKLAWAAEQIQKEFSPTTWRAFQRTAIDGEAPKDVALALGLSPGAVYIAKSRVLTRLKAVLAQLPDD